MNEALKSLVLAELDEDIQDSVDAKNEDEIMAALMLQSARYQRYTYERLEPGQGVEAE